MKGNKKYKILKSLLVIAAACIMAWSMVMGQAQAGDGRYAVTDVRSKKIFIYSKDNELITITDLNNIGIPYFIRDAGSNGWLVKLQPGMPYHKLFEIWYLDSYGTLTKMPDHASFYNSPGLYFTGIKGGNFVTAEIIKGNIYLFNPQGNVVASHNVWTDPNGWSYNYQQMGDVAGLFGGGFVVAPDGGWVAGSGHTGPTPYLYIYDDNLNLVHKKDISQLSLFLYAMTGLASGGFAGIGNYGGDYITHLFYFDAEGNKVNGRNITGDIPLLSTNIFLEFVISSLDDGGVIVAWVGGSNYYVYHSPPVEVDLSGDGITSIGGIGGNYLQADATLIQLAKFIAYPQSGKVMLAWSTESEIDNAGFNLYRSESENGEYIKINDSLIPAQGSSTQGTSYEFVDSDVRNRKTYYYKLEDIDLQGKSTLHGPVVATPKMIYEFLK